MVRSRSLRRGWMLTALPVLLQAQGLPPAPVILPLDAPTPAELLPLRPFRIERSPGNSRVPFDWRGELQEHADLWILDHGAIQAEGLLLLADRIEYRVPDGHLVAVGHVRLEGPDLRLRGERLQMDWALRSGEAWALQMDLPPSWTLRSSHVAFATLRTWLFDEVDLSPCPEEKPGWEAKLSSLKVDLDGFATLWNPRVELSAVPIFYLPYALFPAQAARTSGLISPQLGMSSEFGATVGLSYYQVLGNSADMTISPQYFSKEGALWGGEARWHPDVTHEGSISGMVIHSQSLDTQRYQLNLKEVWQREDGWQLSANVNQASDNLVAADYGGGLGDLGTENFDSSLYLGRNFTFGSLSLTAAEQRSFFTTVNQGDPFYNPQFPASLRRQTLPQGEFRFFPVPTLGALYLDGGIRLGRYAYALEGSATTPNESYSWDRQDADVRLHGRLGQWGPFRADFETMARFTHYSATLSSPVWNPDGGVSGTEVDPATSPFQADGKAADRFLLSEHLRLSGPQIGRSYPDVSILGYHGELKHVLEPYFGFTETSGYSTAGFIQRFDPTDYAPGVNDSASGERSFELGLKQHLLGRSDSSGAFLDLMRLQVATRFHTTPIILSDGSYRKGWASLDTNLDVEPSDRWRLSFHRSSDLSEGGADSALSFDVKVQDGSRFNLAYFSTGINRFLVRQQGVQFGGMQRVWDDRFRLEFNANYDFRMHGFASSSVDLAYVQPCVAYILKFTHVALGTPLLIGGRENRVDLTLNLRGLGDLFNFRH
jgi:hypothetical protein